MIKVVPQIKGKIMDYLEGGVEKTYAQYEEKKMTIPIVLQS